MARSPTSLYNARMRRRGERNMIEPWRRDLRLAGWQKLAGATTPVALQASLAASADSSLAMLFDGSGDPRQSALLGLGTGRFFKFAGLVRLVSMDTGVEPYSFRATYFDDVGGLVSDIHSLTVAGGFTPFELDFTTRSQRSLNLLQWSESMDKGPWDQRFQMNTILSNVAVAPDGTLTADRLAANTSNTIHFHRQRLTKAASPLQYTMSTYLKRTSILTTEYVYITLFDGSSGEAGGRLNLITGALDQLVLTGAVTRDAFFVETLADGWFRLKLTVTMSTSTGVQATIHMGDASKASYTTSFVGDPEVNNVLVWGAQLVLGPNALTYHPTTQLGESDMQLRSNDAAKAATLEFVNLRLTELFPRPGD